MNYKQRCLDHARRAIEIQETVARMEADALVRAKEQRAGRAQSPIGAKTPDEYYQAQILKDDFWYKAACSNRNAHQTMAQVFGIAALVEALP
jgi:hypothetical protein